ncbi:MAG TPA: dual specificity protein phosphatase family protein [Fimbriiglobus sp.]|nr:dual specificity protein phosphatase family protein [Fimbriiglobus sp.]
MPPGFTWIDQPLLAALAMPESADDLAWLRRHGLDVLLSLSEEPPSRRWINDAGLMGIHVPVVDFTAPTDRQIDLCLDAIARAHQSGMGVAVHCTGGKGRTGTILAAYLVTTGLTARAAIDRIRHLRPGSVETPDQEEAVEAFARRWTGG